ncbi:MAG: DUF2207 domain-containing protein [bacterium]
MRLKFHNTKSYLIIAGLLIVVFSFSQTVFADSEIINNFNSNIAIQKNGVVSVTETITYDFGSNQKHGIFRIIPLESTNGPTIDINVRGITDENGNAYPYSNSYEGSNLKIKIGNPNELVSGVKIYVISYNIQNVIRNFTDHDELYWNVTGNEWPVAIQNINTLVSFPQEFSLSELKKDCFTGRQGSTEKACVANYSQNSSASITSGVSFTTSRLLSSGEGLTIVAGFPAGIVPKSSATVLTNHKNSNTGAIAFIFIFGLVFLLIIGSIIKAIVRKGKPQLPPELKNRPIVVEYGPPANLTPTDVGAIFDGNLDNADLASVIIDLAVKGYLKIRYINDDDYEFVKLKDLSGLDHPAYKIIFNFLFVSQNTVKLSELEDAGASFDTERIMNEMQKYLESGGYLKDLNDKDPAVKKYYLSRYAGIILTIFGIFYVSLFFGFGGFQKLGFGGMIFLVFFCGIFSVVIGFFIIAAVFGKPVYGRLAPLGITALGIILGFKEFLRATETDKIKLLNAPELKPELFDHFLPYAMVLGVEKEWAKKFEGLYTMSPIWFEGPAGAFSTTALVAHLSHFGNSFNQTTASSSGFSGGHSGGGSGGGGGGSW